MFVRCVIVDSISMNSKALVNKDKFKTVNFIQMMLIVVLLVKMDIT